MPVPSIFAVVENVDRLAGALTERYRFERELGSGGMATVYLAHDLKHGRRVALKVLRPELAYALGPERFLREIRVTAQLDHPHILPLLDSGEADGFLYYVMPYVEGETLRDLMAREKQVGLDEALRIARDVADALSYAHSNGIIHRDIKPENILLAGGHARVADFGIARAVTVVGGETLTETGLAIGTPAYMSPEQAGGETEVDGRSDVYSLGCVLYEMLAGHPPFTGHTAHEVMLRHSLDALPSLSAARPTVPADIERVIATALAKTPADRYRTAAALAEALAASPNTVRFRPEPFARGWFRVVVGTAIAITLAGFGFVWVRDRSRPMPLPADATVAVLYFENSSADTTDAYLADGLTEELISRLGQVERLSVKSRTAVQRYRGRSIEDPEGLGRALGAAYLVSGTIRRAGLRIRVTVELVRTATGVRAWGEQYDRTGTDLLAIEEEVARGIATAIAGRLLPAEAASLRARPTENAEAYDHVLRGDFYLARRTPRDAVRAVQEYEHAVRLDPRFARALASVAYGYALFLDWAWVYPGVSPEQLLARGLVLVDSAMHQDSSASDVWMARAYLLSHRNPRGFTGVRAAFEQAIRLDPRNAEAYHQLGWILWLLGDDAAAERTFRQALALDPERAITLEHLARMEFARRNYATARRWLDSALILDPGFAFAHQWRARHLLQLGDTGGAQVEAAGAIRLGVPEGGEEVLALTELRAGHTTRARDRLDRALRALPGTGPLAFQKVVYAALALVALGDEARALDLLERVGVRGGAFWSHLRMPEFDAIRSDARFERLVADARPTVTR